MSDKVSDWLGNALAKRLDIDVGSDKANNKQRTDEQQDNRKKLKADIDELVLRQWIEQGEIDTELSNRQKRKSPVYKPTNRLYD